jgi:hypothetical protein
MTRITLINTDQNKNKYYRGLTRIKNMARSTKLKTKTLKHGGKEEPEGN